MIATAPGKLILSGEYAVLGGAPALVVAVGRRAVARRGPAAGPRGSSPFLVALAETLAHRLGDEHPAARAALDIVVDSTQFYDGTRKLGLGSSAAVTVAATALALAAAPDAPPLDRDLVRTIAAEAHAAAQGTLGGAPGSGADVAAAACGGTIAFTAGAVERLAWPAGVTLIPCFTGQSADTRALVAQVEAAHARTPAAVDAALAAIAAASRAACEACRVRDPQIAATGLLAALALGASAIDDLATATRLPLVPPCVVASRRALAALGGTVKTTGAGGGDVAIAVLPSSEQATNARRLLIQCGCTPIDLTLDATGVDLRPDAS